jgi:hypothetical protein
MPIVRIHAPDLNALSAIEPIGEQSEQHNGDCGSRR